MNLVWSDLQNDVFNNVNSPFNITIDATAGSSKTTTLVESINRLKNTNDTLFSSFSNVIVDELKKRVPKEIKTSTLHSLGNGILFQNMGQIKVDQFSKKSFNLALETFKTKNKESFTDSYHISRLLDFCRLTNVELDVELVEAMADKYGLDSSHKYIETAIRILNKPIKNLKIIDFIDMLYLPVKLNLKSKKYRKIFLDESQDTSAIQLALLEKVMQDDTKLISVGDKFQSIYSFSGADSDSFDKIKERNNTKILPLSISYRCPILVVEEAKRINPSIQSWEKANVGKVINSEVEDIKSGDMVLCRTTSPLIKLFFYLINKRIKAKVVGHDLHQKFQNLAKELADYPNNIMAIAYLHRKLDRKYDELQERGVHKPLENPKYIELEESLQVATVLLKHVSFPSQLPALVEQLFGKHIDGVSLMTIHRSKGLEADRVFVIKMVDGKTLIPHPMAKTTDAVKQEKHLEFVAITRAKKELHYLYLDTVKLEN